MFPGQSHIPPSSAGVCSAGLPWEDIPVCLGLVCGSAAQLCGKDKLSLVSLHSV